MPPPQEEDEWETDAAMVVETGRPATKLETLIAKTRAAGVEHGKMEEMDRATAAAEVKLAEMYRTADAANAKLAEMYRAAVEQRNEVTEADRAAARAAYDLYGHADDDADSDYDSWKARQPSTSFGNGR